MSEKPTIPVNFNLISLQPDRRQWKPSNPLVQPQSDFVITVDVPLDKDHVYNAAKILEKQLTSGNVKIPDPVFTPMGMKFIIDTFEAVMSDPEQADVEWDEPKPSKKSSDETWDEEDDELSWEEDEPSEGDLVEDEDVTWDEEETEPSTEPKEEDVEWDEEDI